MTNYREILRLYSQGISQRSIAAGCECSRNTVSKVITRAKELNKHVVDVRVTRIHLQSILMLV